MNPGTQIIVWIVHSVVLMVMLVIGFAYTTLLERKVVARYQARVGPNRAGYIPLPGGHRILGGWLQPLADGIKLIFKEELIPAGADRVVFILAPVITVLPALVLFAVMPFGPTNANLFGLPISLTLAPHLNVGILYILAITSISVYGITLAGWSSNNKYALLGGIRASAQMVSYELSLGLSVVGVTLVAGTLDLNAIVDQQKNIWFIFVQPLGALIFMLSMLAEANRTPFDLLEAEQELVSGFNTEYSGMKFALFYMAEYLKLIAVSGLMATFYLGGYREPFPPFVSQALPWLSVDNVPWLGPIYFLLKLIVLLVVAVWIRATLPRFRYDRLMAFGWKLMLPLALGNVVVTALAILLQS
ncbi:MAG TPA: NADH-quinone oxidoreductase subunit NuoH [Anaerolineae bacterium]|nr:NADH-quinone oxidoreductase subunit NuoH [Anaerolineae bacterium]